MCATTYIQRMANIAQFNRKYYKRSLVEEPLHKQSKLHFHHDIIIHPCLSFTRFSP